MSLTSIYGGDKMGSMKPPKMKMKMKIKAKGSPAMLQRIGRMMNTGPSAKVSKKFGM